jgi:hypothetical protein
LDEELLPEQKGGPALVLLAVWDPSSRRVYVNADTADYRIDYLGARPSAIFELI